MNWDGMGKMMLERSVVLHLLVSLVSAVEIDVVKKTINLTFFTKSCFKGLLPYWSFFLFIVVVKAFNWFD
jgi:hypothetical protein